MVQGAKIVGVLSLIFCIPIVLKAEALHLDDSNFSSIVEKSEIPVLVDFWAPWCGPCLKLAPTIDELAKSSGGKAIVSKINIDDHPEIASRYNIKAIPTIIIFKRGEIMSELRGIQPYEVLASELSKTANSTPGSPETSESTKFPSMMEKLIAIEAKSAN